MAEFKTWPYVRVIYAVTTAYVLDVQPYTVTQVVSTGSRDGADGR